VEAAQHVVAGGANRPPHISELLKARYNAGEASNLYFWRDRSGHEVDLLIDHGTCLSPLEIKSGLRIQPDPLRLLPLDCKRAAKVQYWRGFSGSHKSRYHEKYHVQSLRLYMGQYCLDDHSIFDTGNHLGGATADPTGFHINVEYPLEPLHPRHCHMALRGCFLFLLVCELLLILYLWRSTTQP